VAVGGGEVFDVALQVEHYTGGDLLRTNPRQDQVPRQLAAHAEVVSAAAERLGGAV
jgi:hypothetical protein